MKIMTPLTRPRPGVREDTRTGQFVPTIDGHDVSPTSFDRKRALEIAFAAAFPETSKYVEAVRQRDRLCKTMEIILAQAVPVSTLPWEKTPIVNLAKTLDAIASQARAVLAETDDKS